MCTLNLYIYTICVYDFTAFKTKHFAHGSPKGVKNVLEKNNDKEGLTIFFWGLLEFCQPNQVGGNTIAQIFFSHQKTPRFLFSQMQEEQLHGPAPTRVSQLVGHLIVCCVFPFLFTFVCTL